MNKTKYSPKRVETTPQPEVKPRTLSKVVRGAAVVAGLSLLAGHEVMNQAQTNRLEARNKLLTKRLARVARAASGLAGVSDKTILGEGLVNPNDLKGVGMKVTTEQREMLKQSTVKILKRPKASDAAWIEFCTGLKVKIGDSEFISTASHCFNDDKLNVSANFTGIGRGAAPSSGAVNLSSVTQFEYVISDPELSVGMREHVSPLAKVTGISAMMYGPEDWALLKVGSLRESDSKGVRSWSDIPAVAFSMESPMPTPGEEVAIYGIPQSSQNIPLPTIGRYLGRINYMNGIGTSAPMDIVGLTDAITPDKDACSFGSSGSSALTASGVYLGALSERNNVTFTGDLASMPRAAGGGGVVGNLYNPGDNIVGSNANRPLMEQKLGLNLDGYSTLCLNSTHNNTSTLLQGFKIMAEINPTINGFQRGAGGQA